MGRIPENYPERVYAGWLGKIIGIRHGAPIEGWDYFRIQQEYGEIDGYLVDYHEFAADDDSNGPLFFLHGLETAKCPMDMQPSDVAQALLNYAPYEHGFFWWGGYGRSTEHTAYLNLRSGIPAPRSGSVAQNGASVAEQIGGQIFIDTWGLVSPGNPEQAARLAEAAASVMHDRNGVYGGIFIAVCISLAFLEKDPETIIRKALRYIPQGSEYSRVVNAVMNFHKANPEKSWRDCFLYLWDNFGYDRYPGNCHIIPNAGVIILALLYGNGNFDRTINICNMCGWDTDCNVGNVGSILGVLVGIEGIDYKKWIAPVHDLLICSSVVGSLNIMDIPYGASYIARWAYRLAGEKIPGLLADSLAMGMDTCHFEYPASTHSVYAYREQGGKSCLQNTNQQARHGNRSLLAEFPDCQPGERIRLYKKTYYYAADFYDSRYDPAFSPLVYPGQNVHASVYVPDGEEEVFLSVYVKEGHQKRTYSSLERSAKRGQWMDLMFAIPPLEGGLIEEAGVLIRTAARQDLLSVYLDDLYFDGKMNYSFLPEQEKEDVWSPAHREITQFTRLKGLLYLEGNRLHLSCSDYAEAYTGRHDWRDYESAFTISVHTGETAGVNFRVQGAMRSYAAGFDGKGNLVLLKNDMGYKTLASVPFRWEPDKDYRIRIRAIGNELAVLCDGVALSFRDPDHPWLEGGIGLSVRNGTHASLGKIVVKGI